MPWRKKLLLKEQILRFGSNDQLEDLKELILRHLCHQLELPSNGPKESLCKLLKTYVGLLNHRPTKILI